MGETFFFQVAVGQHESFDSAGFVIHLESSAECALLAQLKA